MSKYNQLNNLTLNTKFISTNAYDKINDNKIFKTKFLGSVFYII